MISAVTWVHELLDAVGAEPKGARLRQCPAHRDSTPSLSIDVGAHGRALVYCHAGCRTDDVLHSLGLSFAHLYRPPPGTPAEHVQDRRLRLDFPPLRSGGRGGPGARGLRLEALHDYGGHVLERWRHPVTGEKEIFWSTQDARGALIPGLRDENGGRVRTDQLPLYLEPDIRRAVTAGETVVVCESESSVDALVRAGVTATTWAGGAAQPNLPRLSQVLRGGLVLLVPDNDAPGRACGRRIYRALGPVTAHLAHLLPAPGQDARDLLARHGPAPFTHPFPSP
jgi:hypothetical protein